MQVLARVISASIQIRDSRRDHIHNLQAQIKLADLGQMRADLSSTGIAVYLGSAVTGPEGLQLLLARDRKFLSSNNPNASLASLLGVDLRPAFLGRVLNEESPGANYVCTYRMDQRPERCTDGKSGSLVEYGARDGSFRTIRVALPGVEVKLEVQDREPKVVDRDATFRLAAPKGFAVSEI